VKQTLLDLQEGIYRHYPKGIPASDPLYKASPEHRRLVDARREAGRLKHRWQELLAHVRCQWPSLHVMDKSLHLLAGDWDAGYVGDLAGSVEGDFTIGFAVSFIVPCYAVYTWTYPEPSLLSRRFRTASLDLTPQQQAYAGPIAEWIARAWPTHQPLSAEMGAVAVPDVATNMCGLGEATVFDCVLTDY
jgi:hypothetical protein